MRIYITHPYGNNPENKAEAEKIVTHLTLRNPEHIFYSPISCFGFMYDLLPYNGGMELCLDLLSLCDEVWVFGDWTNSKGCKIEIKEAEKQGKKVIYNYEL